MRTSDLKPACLFLLGLALAGCGGSKAGAQCASVDDCPDEQACLLNFKGGYCGLTGCTSDDNCPSGTLCVTHDGANYCFLECTDKPQCNEDRSSENEANCSSSVTRVGASTSKACVPPSGT